MEGFKYSFPNLPKVWIVIFACIFGALSCQQGCRCRGCTGCGGCTTSVVVDKETDNMRVDGMKIKLRANKNRITNRQIRIREYIDVDKSRSYAIDYHIRVSGRDALRNICEFGIPRNYDVDDAMDRFTIKFSPDKKHFAVGLDKNVYDFFHMLKKGVPFSSGCYYINDQNYTYLSDANIKFDDIEWSRFPSPDALLDKIVLPNDYSVWTYTHNQSNILMLLGQLKPGNEHDIHLIRNWYNDIADQHFTKQRVYAIKKVSPGWVKIAKESLLKIINESSSDVSTELGASLDMVLWIDDKELLNTVDKTVFEKYFAEGNAGNYLVERLANNNNSLNNSIKDPLITESLKVCSNNEGSSVGFDDKISIEDAIEVLLLSKKENDLKNFINSNVTISKIENSFTNVPDLTIKKYDKYPKELQGLMVEKYTEVMKTPGTDIFSLTISEIVRFLQDKIKCSDLKEIVKLHKEDLGVYSLPARCK